MLFKLFSDRFLRRRQYLINQDFQFRYIGLLVGIASIFCLVFVAAAKYYINANLDPIIESGLVSSPVINELVQLEKSFLNKNLLTVFLILIGGLTIVGIFITHRIAGPIYALERKMKQIIQEGIGSGHLQIRKTDEFQELVETFNEMIHSLQRQLNEQQEKIEKLKKEESIDSSETSGRSKKAA